MKFSNLVVSALVLVAGVAQAKISTYTNESALEHILKSREIQKLKAPGGELANLELGEVKLTHTGGLGIGAKYEAEIEYNNTQDPSGNAGFASYCRFTATVENVKNPKAPAGITASRLSNPTLSTLDCVQ